MYIKDLRATVLRTLVLQDRKLSLAARDTEALKKTEFLRGSALPSNII